mgnify:CR=1 FL=1
MSHWNNLPQLRLGVYPTPFYRLENISRIYNKSIWIKRDDLCGVALGGNKVRKLEYLLAEAQKQGCDTVFTTEYSIRTAMEAVYTLCNVDRGVPEVWGSVYDIRDLLYATSKLLDGKKPLEFLLPSVLPLLDLVKEPLVNNVVVDLLKKYNIV